ncbi:MAG: hypothetical protein JWN78_1761 [Bacteroidota bacterium]|nr:hypothetical protein [Bacteroidota bacterium]
MRYAFIFSIVVLLFSCTKETKDKSQFEQRDQDAGKIAFQYEYINFAWGYAHYTWFVDTNGVVRYYRTNIRYHQTSDRYETWKSTDSAGYISTSDLQFNYALCYTIYRLDSSEVRQKSKLISLVDETTLTDSINAMADAGAAVLYCYIWDPSKQKYKRLLLKQEGDWDRSNLNANAMVLSHWLINKGEQEIKQFFWYY